MLFRPDPKVGCVAEKTRGRRGRVGSRRDRRGLLEIQSKLKSSTTASTRPWGPLETVRRAARLWRTMPEDTLLDDFVLSMLIAADGYKIAYCKEARWRPPRPT